MNNLLKKTLLFCCLGAVATTCLRFVLFSGSGLSAWSDACFFTGLTLLVAGLFLYTLTLHFYDFAIYSFRKGREERRIRNGEKISEKLPEYHEFLAEREKKTSSPFPACLISGAVFLAVSLSLALALL